MNNLILENFGDFKENLITEAFQSSILTDIFGKSDNKGKQMIQKLSDKDGENIALNTISDTDMKRSLWTNTANDGEYMGNYQMTDVEKFKNTGYSGKGAGSETITIFTINNNVVAVVARRDYDKKQPYQVIANNIKGIKRRDFDGLLKAINKPGLVGYTFSYANYSSTDTKTRSKVAGSKIKVASEIKLSQEEKLEIFKGLEKGDVGILTLVKSIRAAHSPNAIDSDSFRKSIKSMIPGLLEEINKQTIIGNELKLKASDIALGLDGDNVYLRMDFNKGNNSRGRDNYYNGGYHSGIISVNLSKPRDTAPQVSPKKIYGTMSSNWFPSYELSYYEESGMKTKRKYAKDIKLFQKSFTKNAVVKNIVKFIDENKTREKVDKFSSGQHDRITNACRPYTEALHAVIEKILRRMENQLHLHDRRGRGRMSDWTTVRILPSGTNSEHATFSVGAGSGKKGPGLVKKSMKEIVTDLNDLLGSGTVTGNKQMFIVNKNFKISELSQ